MSFMDTVKGWFSKAKDTAGDVKEKAAPMVEKAGDIAEGAWDKTKDVAGDVKEKAAPMVEKAWDKAKDVAEDVKDKFDGDEDEKEAPTE
jgi:uncharacterized protein YjbJ (UPF0337 family)